jgi:uncharacterized membrane protein
VSGVGGAGCPLRYVESPRLISSRVRNCRYFVAASLSLLVGLELLDSALQQPPLIVWLMRVLPLLIFVPGMWRDKLRSYIWLCFVCLLYFMVLVLRLFAEPTNMLLITAMASLVTLFISSMLYVRWRARELQARQALPG